MTANDETRTLVKVLCAHDIAGGIIGKKGATITSLQEQHGVRLRVSLAGQFFPGTSERVALIVGTVPSVLSCLAEICARIKEDGLRNRSPSNAEFAFSLRLVVPLSSVGRLIGKGGEMVRQIQEKSQAKLAFLKETPDGLRFEERICEVTGTEDRLKEALSLICQKLSEDPLLDNHQSINYSSFPNFGGSSFGGSSFGGSSSPNSFRRHTPGSLSPNSSKGGQSHANGVMLYLSNILNRGDVATYNTKVEVHVPDAYAGAIIGNRGHQIREIQSMTHTSIHISPRVSDQRTVEITGPVSSVWCAHAIIVDKVVQEEKKRSRGGSPVKAD